MGKFPGIFPGNIPKVGIFWEYSKIITIGCLFDKLYYKIYVLQYEDHIGSINFVQKRDLNN